VELHYILSTLGLLGFALFRVSYPAMAYAYVLAHFNPPKAKSEFRSLGVSRNICPHIASLVAFGLFGVIDTSGFQSIANASLVFVGVCYILMWGLRTRGLAGCRIISTTNPPTVGDSTALFDETTETKLIYIRDDPESRPSFIRIIMITGFTIRLAQCLSMVMLIHDVLDSRTESDLSVWMIAVELFTSVAILFYPVGGTASTARWAWGLHVMVVVVASALDISSCFETTRYYPESITSAFSYALYSLVMEVPFHLIARMHDKMYVNKKLDAAPVLYRFEVVNELAAMTAVAVFSWIPPITLPVISLVYIVLVVALVFAVTCGCLQFVHANISLNRATYALASAGSGGSVGMGPNGTVTITPKEQSKQDKGIASLLNDDHHINGASDTPPDPEQLKELDSFIASTVVDTSSTATAAVNSSTTSVTSPSPAPATQTMVSEPITALAPASASTTPLPPPPLLNPPPQSQAAPGTSTEMASILSSAQISLIQSVKQGTGVHNL